MKKILGILAGVSLLALLLLPMVALAQETIPTECVMRRDPQIVDCNFTADGDICSYEENQLCGMCCLMSTVYYITDWMFTILIVLVVIFVVWGGFQFLTAAGDTEKITAGRNRIMYAGIGLAIALLARAVPAIVRYLVAPGA